MLIFAEPVNFVAQGEYNLNALKEVKATESFLGLDQEVRGCQNEESLHKCSTRKHIKNLIEQCGCLPFNMRLSDEVGKIKTRLHFHSYSWIKAPLCSSNEHECVKKVQNYSYNCLEPCSGLILTSFIKTDPKENLDSLFSNEIAAYNDYSKWLQFPSGIKGNMYTVLIIFMNWFL